MISIQNEFKTKLKQLDNRGGGGRINIVEGIERFEKGVLSKACILNGIVKERTIGPGETNPENPKPDVAATPAISFVRSVNFATSTPHPKSRKHNIGDNNVFNLSTIERRLSAIGRLPPVIDTGKKVINDDLEKLEEERRQNVETRVWEKMMELRKAEEKIAESLREEMEVVRMKAKRDEARKRDIEEEEHRINEALHWKQLSEERCVQRLSEANERVRKALEKQQEMKEQQWQRVKERERLDAVYRLQVEYRGLYQQLQEAVTKCSNPSQLTTALYSETARLRTTNEDFNLLIDKCKMGSVSEEDLKEGESIVDQIREILKLFRKSAKQSDSINRVEEWIEKSDTEKEKEVQTKEEEEANKNKEKEVIEKQETKGSDAASHHDDLDDCIERGSFNEYLKLKRFLEVYEDSIGPLLADESLKKLRFSCQRAVNIPVNAISPYSREHMQDKYAKLARLLKGQPVSLGNSTFTASSHPLGVQFCNDLLARKFVSQGEQTVSSKPEAAFAIAAICVSLWTEFPDFGTLLLAHFQRECPYLVPVLMPQVEGQSDTDYYKVLGYQYIDGKIESQDKFLKRMSGLMRLYSAIIIASPRPRDSKDHPLGLKEGWRWLATTLNLEPRADISATLILDMLEVTGSEMMSAYGNQFRKLLHLLCTEYFVRMEAVTPEGCGGPVRRLKTFLETVLRENRIPPPAGRLAPDVW